MSKQLVSRRKFLHIVSLAATGVIAASCAPASQAPAEAPTQAPAEQAEPTQVQATEAPQAAAAATGARATIRVVSGQDVTELQVRQLIADNFNKAQDKVTAEVVIVKGDRYQSQQTMIAGGNAPDILYLNPWFMYVFADKGVLKALDDYVARDSFSFDGIDPTAVDIGRYLGKLVAMPFEIAPLTVVYNKKLFDAASVPYPTTDWEESTWTWDAFVEMARKLTDAKNEQYGVQFDNWMYPALVYQNGGKILSNRKEIQPDTKCVLDSEEAVSALQWLVDLSTKNQVSAPAAAINQLGGFDRFMAGKIGMYIYGRWLNTFRTIKDFEWDVAALPHVQGKKPATLLLDLHYAVYSGSKNPDAGWEYLKYIITEEPQKANVNTGMAVAVLQKVNEMPVFLESYPPHNERVYIDALKYSIPEDVNAATQAYSAPMNAELEGVFAGTRPVKEGAAAAAKEVNKVLDEWRADK